MNEDITQLLDSKMETLTARFEAHVAKAMTEVTRTIGQLMGEDRQLGQSVLELTNVAQRHEAELKATRDLVQRNRADIDAAHTTLRTLRTIGVGLGGLLSILVTMLTIAQFMEGAP